MILLLDILSMCAHVGDKALVFSQSIPTLDLIELYLSRVSRRGKQGKFWKKGKDWYRWVSSSLIIALILYEPLLRSNFPCMDAELMEKPKAQNARSWLIGSMNLKTKG